MDINLLDLEPNDNNLMDFEPNDLNEKPKSVEDIDLLWNIYPPGQGINCVISYIFFNFININKNIYLMNNNIIEFIENFHENIIQKAKRTHLYLSDKLKDKISYSTMRDKKSRI